MAEFKNEFSWSVSRDSMFNECKRRYYYYYYGSWGGWEKSKADDVTRTLYVLKQLQNRRMWKGSAVHEEIRKVLKELITSGRLTPVGISLNRLSDTMREKWKSSTTRSYRKNPKRCALFEHEYDVNLPKEEWKRIHKEAETCIKNFFSSSILKELQNTPKERIISLEREKPISFDFEGVLLYVNLDLGYYREDGKDVIVDWKTGDGESDPLQFVCYVIFLVETLGINPKRISVVEYNLLKNLETVHRFAQDELLETSDHIRESISQMKTYLENPIENVALMKNSPRTEDEWKCEACNFKKICFSLP